MRTSAKHVQKRFDFINRAYMFNTLLIKPKYMLDLKQFETKITFISKLRIIL